MRISDIALTLDQICNADKLLLIGVRATYEYKDGQKTDNIIGSTYETVAVKSGYDKVFIKTPELVPAISPEEIDNSGIWVKPQNFIGKIYMSGNELKLSAKADTVTRIQTKQAAQ